MNPILRLSFPLMALGSSAFLADGCAHSAAEQDTIVINQEQAEQELQSAANAQKTANSEQAEVEKTEAHIERLQQELAEAESDAATKRELAASSKATGVNSPEQPVATSTEQQPSEQEAAPEQVAQQTVAERQPLGQPLQPQAMLQEPPQPPPPATCQSQAQRVSDRVASVIRGDQATIMAPSGWTVSVQLACRSHVLYNGQPPSTLVLVPGTSVRIACVHRAVSWREEARFGATPLQQNWTARAKAFSLGGIDAN